MKTLIVNGRILTPRQVLQGYVLGFDADKIAGIWPENDLPQDFAPSEKLDAGGQYVSPGFVDIHEFPVLPDGVGSAAIPLPHLFRHIGGKHKHTTVVSVQIPVLPGAQISVQS